MSASIRAAVAALLACAASPGFAQPATPRPAPSASAAAPVVSASTPGAPAYRSAFDGYRRHADQPVGSWQEANDRVGRIGGWRAYAREAQGGDAASAPADRRPEAPSGAASGASKGGHAGHAKP